MAQASNTGGQGFPKARLLRGAFEVYEARSTKTPKLTIRFLFNPEKVTRNIAPNVVSEEATSSGRQDTKSVKLPSEKITIDVRLDASVLVDRKGEVPEGAPVAKHGILPIISALEWLIYPASSGGETSGSANYTPKYEMPYVIFVWNESIRLPVKVTGINITEYEFGPNLFPTRADVQVAMDVITSDDTKLPDDIKNAYTTTIKFREEMMRTYGQEQFSLS